MRKRLLFLTILGTVCFAAQQPAPPQTRAGTIVKLRVDRVPVLFSALDRKERFVTDLSREEIEVRDNKRKADIIEFVKESDLPLRIGLLVDSSNSVRDRFKFEQEAATEFLQSVLRPKSDRAFVISFDTNAEVVQDFTEDTNKLSQAILSLRPGGGTALYDAIYHAARDKLMEEGPAGSVRRAIVVLSDGEDNQSRVSREDTVAMAQRAELTIYAISTNSTGVKQRGDRILERFAEETGGRVYFPFRMSDLNRSFEQIGLELRSQYSLLFRPNTPRDGSFHSIEVVSLRKGVRVRARKGYFAAKE